MDRALKVTAFLKLFVQNFKANKRPQLTIQDLANAFAYIAKNSQIDIFLKEDGSLRKKTTIPACSRLQSLCSFLEEHDCLRTKGRPSKATIVLSSCHPVTMDAQQQPNRLFLQHIHDSNGYCGLEHSRSIVAH